MRYMNDKEKPPATPEPHEAPVTPGIEREEAREKPDEEMEEPWIPLPDRGVAPGITG